MQSSWPELSFRTRLRSLPIRPWWSSFDLNVRSPNSLDFLTTENVSKFRALFRLPFGDQKNFKLKVSMLKRIPGRFLISKRLRKGQFAFLHKSTSLIETKTMKIFFRTAHLLTQEAASSKLLVVLRILKLKSAYDRRVWALCKSSCN